MAFLNKVLAVVLILGVLLVMFRNHLWVVWVAAGIILLLFLIRVGADIYWWGNDKGKW